MVNADPRRSRSALTLMVGALLATAVAFTYTMAFAIPNEPSARIQDWLVVGGLTAVGLGYVIWAAISNGSLVVGLLGTTEVLLVAGPGFLAIRAIRHSAGPVVTLILAVALLASFLYPWTKVDRIRAAIWARTRPPLAISLE